MDWGLEIGPFGPPGDDGFNNRLELALAVNQ